jgi:peptidoglycan/xylan/chitin deacetylase (PgdA/CDA1 family)
MSERPRITRRQLVVGVVAAAGLAACDNVRSKAAAPTATTAGPPAATSAPPTQSGAAPTTLPPAPTAPAPSAAPATSAAPHGPATFVNHGARTDPRVALTFHASGDAGLATQLLDELEARDTRVTVFGVGQWLEANPELVARMLTDGHELGNHTFSHQSMGQLSASRIAQEITGCAEVLTKLTGSISAWFRPSGIEVPTDAILDAAGTAGYPVSVGYDVDSLDFEDPGPAAVEANVRKSVQAGSIVSLHFGHQGTVEAIGSVLDHLSSVGLQTATVGQLLA